MKTELFNIESRRAEQALRESEQKYKRLLASVTDYIYSVTVDHGEPVATSHGPGCEAVTGYTPAEFEADPLLWYRMVHEKDRSSVLAQASRVLKGERASPLEHRIIHKNGSVRWIRSTPVPHRDPQGKLVGYDGSVTDITEIKQSEARFRGLLESAPDAIVIVSAENKIVLINSQAETLFGYKREELLGESVDKLVPPRFRKRHAGQRSKYMTAPGTRPMGAGLELYGLRKDGTEFPVDISLSPLVTDQGTIVAAAIRDITRQKQAEKLLKESEERFRQLAENINEVFWMTNATKDEMIYVSPAYEGIWGRSCQSLYASPRNWMDAIHGEDRNRVLQAAEKQRNAHYDEEYRIVRPDGSTRWIHDRAFPVRDDSGAVYRIVGIAEDITERNRAESARAHFAAIVESSQDAIITKTLDGIITTWNPGAERLFGHLARDAIGKSAIMLNPPERKNEEQEILARLARGEIVDHFETVRLRIDGTQIHVSVTMSPIKEPHGRVTGISCIARDISERKRAEEQHRQDEARLQAIMDNSPLVIHLKDTQGRYILINRWFEEVFHLKREDVLGKTPLDLFPRQTADSLQNHDQAVLAALSPLEFEETLPQDDGLHTYLSSKFPLLDSRGVAYALCAIATDITERRRAEEQLQQTNAELTRNQEALKRALHEVETSHENLKTTQLHLVRAAKLESVGTLAAGVAHEVKNPLQTILLGLDYLACNLPADTPRVQGVLTDMRDAVLRARMIVGELLQFSATNDFAKEKADLNSVVERSLRLIHRDIIVSRITVVKRLDSGLPCVSINPQKIEQVFINLFLNALQAMPAGGVLTVTTRAGRANDIFKLTRPFFPCDNRHDKVVIAEVQDTGAGIAETDLPRIFDPFFTTKPVGVGAGLGLPVVKTIVGRHGGAIDIKNAPQGGVLATLVLKALPDEQAENKSEIAQTAGGKCSGLTLGHKGGNL